MIQQNKKLKGRDKMKNKKMVKLIATRIKQIAKDFETDRKEYQNYNLARLVKLVRKAGIYV